MGRARNKGTHCTIVVDTALLYKATLAWYRDAGVDVVLRDDPCSHFTKKEGIVSYLPSFGEPATTLSSLEVRSVVEASSINTLCTLEDLRIALNGFEGCSLPKTATHMVFGTGSIGASIMVIGDAPMEEEDQSGYPFMGQTGQMLDKIFACINLSRKQVYLTYAINWRPPGNRAPTPLEMESLRPFLARHIALISPKIVIAMGSVAAGMVLGQNRPISTLRGKWHKYDDAKIMVRVTYGPSFLVHTPMQKRVVWADMLAIQKALVHTEGKVR